MSWPALLAALLAGLAAAVAVGDSAARHRLRGLAGRRVASAEPDPASALIAGEPPGPGAEPPVGRWESVRARRAVAVLAGLGAAVLIGGVSGLVAVPIVAFGVDRVVARLEPRRVRVRRARMVADLPLAADLLVACLRAGRPVEASVEAVARAFDGPLGRELAGVVAALRIGTDGAVAWARFVDEPALAPFGRAMVRAWDSGAPLADVLDRLADDARRARRAAAEERARSVGVRAAAPLGLCFLPAFLLIGVAPVIIGTVQDLLTG